MSDNYRSPGMSCVDTETYRLPGDGRWSPSEMTIGHLANTIAFVKNQAEEEHDENFVWDVFDVEPGWMPNTRYQNRAAHWVPILQAELTRRVVAIEIRAAEIAHPDTDIDSLTGVEFDWFVHGESPPHAVECTPDTDEELAGCLARWIEDER